MDPVEGHRSHHPPESGEEDGHAEHGAERDEGAGIHPVHITDGHRRQQRAHEEPDEEAAVGEDLDDGP